MIVGTFTGRVTQVHSDRPTARSKARVTIGADGPPGCSVAFVIRDLEIARAVYERDVKVTIELLNSEHSEASSSKPREAGGPIGSLGGGGCDVG